MNRKRESCDIRQQKWSKTDSAEFQLQPIRRFQSRAPLNLQKPEIICDFSIDGEEQFHNDNRNLSLMKMDWNQSQPNEVQFDLKLAFDEREIGPPNEGRPIRRNNHLLSSLMKNREKLCNVGASTNQNLPVDFVCTSNRLLDIMKVAYSPDSYIALATKYKQTIYLINFQTPEKIELEKNPPEMMRKASAWGLKFEQFMTKGSDPKTACDEGKEYNCVVRSRLGNHTLLYGVEMDAVDESRYNCSKVDMDAFVELKVTKEVESERERKSLYKIKMQKWWGQCYVSGVPRIVCGFRNNDGIVNKLQTINVKDLPIECSNYWSDEVMINCLDQFLTWVKQQVTEDNPRLVYMFTKEKYSRHITCKCLGEESSEKSFLPDWYINGLFGSVAK